MEYEEGKISFFKILLRFLSCILTLDVALKTLTFPAKVHLIFFLPSQCSYNFAFFALEWSTPQFNLPAPLNSCTASQNMGQNIPQNIFFLL